jgi:MarR family transcriptional regulator, organic hydroperoxide resistance regulator
MSEDIRVKVATDLLSIQPLIFRGIRRKLAKKTMLSIYISITPLHFEILKLLEDEGSLHVAQIGSKLQVAKAQMTQLINKLVDSQLVERKADLIDRRIVNISLTEKGRSVLDEKNANMNAIVREIISSIPDNEIEELSVLLKKLQVILSKLKLLG